MFSKAKRFEPLPPPKSLVISTNKHDKDKVQKACTKSLSIPSKQTAASASSTSVPGSQSIITKRDTNSNCSSSAQSVRSFVTPKPVKNLTNSRAVSSAKKTCSNNGKPIRKESKEEVLKAQEVEIQNKNHTLMEYRKQIEELKSEIAELQRSINTCNELDKKFSQINLNENYEKPGKENSINISEVFKPDDNINNLKNTISQLENQCEKLEEEVSSKQVELSALEEVITIRDSLCKDLQDKLSSTELCLEETRQRLEMVKGHHALALEANESIRREYKIELETIKTKLEEEKQAIICKNKADQESMKLRYDDIIESIKNQMLKEKDDVIHELQEQLNTKEREFKAKFDQINEATHEKLRLCEIQFEERARAIQDHWSLQQSKIQYLEKETKDLQYSLSVTEEQNIKLQSEINILKNESESLKSEKFNILKQIDELKDESKKKIIDFENQINKLTVEVDKATKEKSRFEMSLSVTRDIVQVLTMRLRESDSELEHLENTVQTLTNDKEILENELASYKGTLKKTVLECNEYKDALVNILKSKAALAKEHNRIMEHNVSLIESLQNVEKEAYRELGSIKSELIEDVEMLKKESNSQIQMLREEVEKKRMLCELATEHAGQATVAAEQSRALLAQAAAEISRLEAENGRYQQQIEDQQSLVVELSLLRQENEELSMTVAKQSSIIDKMKKDMEQIQSKPKSPSAMRKTHKLGKENFQTVVSPLRERNH
ncbi:unnamed protein product [Chilo suppressalis]|uniref:Hyaluronan-mediated motility receptor C-terminal domain-containing protein n=1 Tax=Chilo suppressalis TaxID=168631 RepID=A0ABN8EBS9_CHISP|nr:hypothetical protein evm_006974 [Chilo suppressalis]CAH0663911.1 unnamed protein product [Chilo suppressalis]